MNSEDVVTSASESEISCPILSQVFEVIYEQNEKKKTKLSVTKATTKKTKTLEGMSLFHNSILMFM